MPKTSKSNTSNNHDHGVVLDRFEDVGGYTISFVEFRENVDATALLKGCPDDRCQCPHWGYVLSGALTLKYAGGPEVYEAGDAFYWPPGHVPIKHQPGTEIVMFSPTAELRAVEAVMMKNMKAMQAGAG